MKKIDKALEEEIESHPKMKIDVLITLREGYNPEGLKLAACKVLMDNIIHSNLDGQEIKRLVKNRNVISVEKDAEMGIL